MEMLYHGSIAKDIKVMKPISKFHDNPEKTVVYLTQSKLYSLFYIWDEKKTNSKCKHVTCWCKNGIVYYEEQYSNQLQKLYDGVSGYIYSFKKDSSFYQAKSEHIWVSDTTVRVTGHEKVIDVYNLLLDYEKNGKLVIYRFEDLYPKQKEIVINKVADWILMKDMLNVECEEARFIKKNNQLAWERALELSKIL